MAGNASGIRAGRAFVEIGTNDSELEKGLKKAQNHLSAFAHGVHALVVPFGAVGAAITGVAAVATHEFAAIGSELHDLSDRTGFSVESLSGLSLAAKLAGSSIQELEVGVKKMQKTITEAAAGSKSATEAFEAMGLPIEGIVGLNPETQFKAIADAVAAIDDPTERAAASLKVFGRSGTQLLPLMKDGAAGVEALQKKAEELGLTMTGEAAASADKLGDSIDTMQTSIHHVAVAIGEALAPNMTALADTTTTYVAQAIGWIHAHEGLVTTTVTLGAALVGTAATVASLGLAATATASAFKGWIAIMHGYQAATKLATMTTAALNTVMLASPWALVIGGIAAFAAGYALYQAIAGEAAESTGHLAQAAGHLTEQNDAALQSDLSRVRTLEALAGRTNLTGKEMETAKRILMELQGSFPGFKAEIDESTGSITLSADAVARFNEEAQRATVTRLASEIDALTKQADELNDKIQGRSLLTWTANKNQAKDFAEFEKTMDKIVDVRRRLAAALRGDQEGVFGKSKAGAPDADVESDSKAKLKRAEQLGADAERNLAKARIDNIEDAHARRIATINAESDAAEQAAIAAGVAWEKIDLIAQTRNLKLGQAERDRARQLADESAAGADRLAALRADLVEGDFAHQMAVIDAEYSARIRRAYELGKTNEAMTLAEEAALKKKKALQDRQRSIDDANKSRTASIEELRIRAGATGIEQERQLLALEERRALLEAEKKGESLDLVRQEFDLRRQILEMEQASHKDSSVLSFDADLINRQFAAAFSVEAVQANAARATAAGASIVGGGKASNDAKLSDLNDWLKKIYEEIKNNHLVFS